MNKLFQKIGISIAAFSLIGSIFAAQAGAIGPFITWGPVPSGSPDSGTCGNNWANDTFDRVFTMYAEVLHLTGNFTVREDFTNGTFVTLAGSSPEGCGKDPGGVVGAGIPGTITKGYFIIHVSNGVFHPNVVCTPDNCGTTAAFVASVFGSQATYDIPTFFFNYVTDHNGSWTNASADLGGDLGDITGNL